MVGLDVPAIPVQHQYIVTDSHPALVERKEAGLPEMPVLRESDASYYLREERQGMILGPYEKGAPACFVDGVPESFGQDLFPGDLDRLEPHIEAAMNRVPIFAEAGIKTVVNGPISYTPDGSPMVGPAWGLKNFWLSEGHSFGVTAAGGSGWQLAEWIVEGEPASTCWTSIPAASEPTPTRPIPRPRTKRPMSTSSSSTTRMRSGPPAGPTRPAPSTTGWMPAARSGGQRYGWERPNWFAPEGVERKDRWSFRRTNYFEHVGNECRTVRERAGLIDITSFSKFQVSGPGAEAFLDGLVARRMPKGIGRINLAHALTPRGGVRSEFTIMRDGPESFYLISSGAAERFDHDFLVKRAPTDGSVRIDNVTTAHGVLVLAGPRSRDILSKVTDTDLSNEAFRWLTGQHILIGSAPVRAMRINFVGDLGWELHHPIEYQNHLLDQLVAAGEEFGLACAACGRWTPCASRSRTGCGARI